MSGEGGIFSGLFGGGASAPKPAPPLLRGDTAEPEAKSVRDLERKKLRAKANGVNGTLLGGGALGGSGKLGQSLLGGGQ